MAKAQWSFKSATELSAALAAKQVSAVELAQDAIGRIERHDGKINAICVRDFDRGLEAARAADAALARGEHKPLLVHFSAIWCPPCSKLDREVLKSPDVKQLLGDRFIGVTGKILLQVYPKNDVWVRENQEEFIKQLQGIDPNVTGTPIQLCLDLRR